MGLAHGGDGENGPAHAPARTRFDLAWIAWIAPALILVLEVLALQARFTTAQFSQADGSWGRAVLALRELPRVSLLAITALIVLGRHAAVRDFAELRRSSALTTARWGFVALQLGAFALLWAAAARLLERADASTPARPALLVGWLALAALCLLLTLRATAEWHVWLDLLRRRARLFGVAGLVGAAAWVAGWLSQSELREFLRLPTLRVAYAMLVPFTDGAYVAPQAFEFGTARFAVDLAPECSGLDGIGLTATFTLAWLLWMRRELRFPRALLLLPIGIAATWLLNAARLAALVLIGERASGEAAVAGFHSVAGLVLFCMAAIATVTLGHADFFQRTRAARTAVSIDPTAAYLLPLVLWIGVGLLAAALPMSVELRLLLRTLAVIAALFVGRRWLVELWRPPTASGLLLAAACVALALVLPAEVQQQVSVSRASQSALQVASTFIAAVLVAPLAEELAFRGYLLRRPGGTHFERLTARAGGALGVVLSSLLFGLLHPAWFAGLAFGLLFALAYLWKGRWSDAWLAHALTNLALLLIAV